MRIAGINLAYPLGNEAVVLHRYAATHDILGADWDVLQDTHNGGDRAGSALAIRKNRDIKVIDWDLTLMSPKGHEVQDRYLLTAVLRVGKIYRSLRRRRVFLVGHLALPGTHRQDDGVRHIRKTLAWIRTRRPWMFIGDVNMTVAEFQAAIDAPHAFGRKPMAAAWSVGWGDVETELGPVSAGTDHHVLKLTVRAGRSV